MAASLCFGVAACARSGSHATAREAASAASTNSAAPTANDILKEVQQTLLTAPVHGNEGARKAAALLTIGIQAHPDNDKLWLERANMYANLHDYASAIADFEHASRIKPLYPEAELELCMLIDRIQGYSPQAKACYARTLTKYKNAHTPGSPPSSNYVIAALAARSPNAESLRRSYLAAHRTGVVADAVRQFNREAYVHEIFP